MGANYIQRNKHDLKMERNKSPEDSNNALHLRDMKRKSKKKKAVAPEQVEGSSTKTPKASRKIKRKRQTSRIKIEPKNCPANTNTENEQQTEKQTIRDGSTHSRKSIKKSKRRGERPASKKVAMIPVFMLPSNMHLTSIPENAEVHRGYILNMKLKPHEPENRRFSGLMSLSNADERAIRKSVSEGIDFHSFADSNIPIVGDVSC